MSSNTKLLSSYIQEFVKTPKTHKKLWVFDFDDTLVKTDAKVHVTTPEGVKFDLSPGEFAVYDKKPGEIFDYADFHKLINPRAVRWTNKILRNVYAHHGAKNIVILSARSADLPIRQFLKQQGFDDIEVVALDTASPHAKASWIDARIKRDGYESVEFLDDSHKNIEAVRELRHDHPDVLILARHIMSNKIASLHR